MLPSEKYSGINVQQHSEIEKAPFSCVFRKCEIMTASVATPKSHAIVSYLKNQPSLNAKDQIDLNLSYEIFLKQIKRGITGMNGKFREE